MLLSFVLFLTTCASASTEQLKVKQIDTRLSDDGRYFSFATRQDIKAPVWDIRILNESYLAPGYWFIAPYEEKTQTVAGDAWVGPHIYDGQGDLIWSGTPGFGHWNVFDFDAVEIDGKPHLSGLDWQNQRGVVLDDSYQMSMTTPSVASVDTFQNMHGFTVVDNGRHGIVQTVKHWTVPADITYESIGYNGSCDANYEGFREMDLQSPGGAKVLFDWDGRKIGLNESKYIKFDGTTSTMCKRGWDLLHVNAVDKCPDGDYLLSARHTDALYKISHTTGDIVWRLGGVMSDFKMPKDATFSRQHDSRCLKQTDTHTIVSLFDNAVGEHWQPATRRASRGLVLALDTQNMTAAIVSQYEHPTNALTDGRGSFRFLPNENAFLNWAKASLISEHTSDGQVIMTAHLKANHDTYRAFKHPWIGKPSAPPDVHSEIVWSEDRRVSTDVFMSWNGATQVANWNVRGTDANGNEIEIASKFPRNGFETALQYDGYVTNVHVTALDRDGNVLSTSQKSTTPELPSATQSNGHLSIAAAIAACIISSVFGVLLALAGRWAYHDFMRRRVVSEQREKGTYAAVVQDEESWELAEDTKDSRPQKQQLKPGP